MTTSSGLYERVRALRVRMVDNAPFFAHVAMAFRIRVAEEGDRVQTAAVTPDGLMIFASEFVDGLNDEELTGLICHETLHAAMLIWQRMKNRKAVVLTSSGPMLLFNIAHDYVINAIIEDVSRSHGGKHIKLPPNGLLDRKYDGMSAEEIYDLLLNKMPSVTAICEGVGGAGSLGDVREDLSDTKDGVDAGKGNESAQRRLENGWKVTLAGALQIQERYMQKGKGDMPASLRKMVEDILHPKLEWKEVLSRWVGENGKRSDYTYRRPARRSESVGEFLPSFQKHGTADLVILWDTSGSMNGRETEILGEVSGICDDCGVSVRVIACDAIVHADVDNIGSAMQILDDKDKIVVGGGGSNFNPAFALLVRDQFRGVVIAFTDGMIDVPQEKPALLSGVLWVVGESESPPTSVWGDVLHIPKETKK